MFFSPFLLAGLCLVPIAACYPVLHGEGEDTLFKRMNAEVAPVSRPQSLSIQTNTQSHPPRVPGRFQSGPQRMNEIPSGQRRVGGAAPVTGNSDGSSRQGGRARHPFAAAAPIAVPSPSEHYLAKAREQDALIHENIQEDKAVSQFISDTTEQFGMATTSQAANAIIAAKAAVIGRGYHDIERGFEDNPVHDRRGAAIRALESAAMTPVLGAVTALWGVGGIPVHVMNHIYHGTTSMPPAITAAVYRGMHHYHSATPSRGCMGGGGGAACIAKAGECIGEACSKAVKAIKSRWKKSTTANNNSEQHPLRESEMVELGKGGADGGGRH